MGWPIAAFVATTLLGINEQRKQVRATREANKLQQRIADVKASRERSKLLAEARIKRARLANLAVQGGVGDSSSAIAGQSQITSQAASGVSFLDQIQTLGKQSNAFMQDAADAGSRANLFGTIAGVSGNIADRTGAWEKLFN